MSYLCYLCLLVYSGLQHFLLLYVLYVYKFLVPCCDVSYDFRKKQSYVRFVFTPTWSLHLLFLLLNLLFFAHGRVKHFLDVWVVWRGRNCLPFVITWNHSRVFGGVRVPLRFSVMLRFALGFCLYSSCVSCAQCCQCLWIVHSWLPFGFL